MAIMDTSLEFADATSIVGSTGSTLIGDVIDLSSLRDIGMSSPDLRLVITVTTTVDSSGDAATVNFQLRSDDAAAISPTTGTLHYQSGVLAEADLVAGYVVCDVPLPFEGSGTTYERFLGINTVVAGEAVTAGAVNAFIVRGRGVHKVYPDAVN